MQEKLLHFIWENRKLPWRGLRTTTGEPIQVHSPGERNLNAGPDFLNADISIGPLRWSGPVELHLRSSDWYVHRHQDDPNYKNVILHLVWQDDQTVSSSSGVPLPTVVMSRFIDPAFLRECSKLLDQGWTHFIPCEPFSKSIPTFALRAWWEELFLQRVERKVDEIRRLLVLSNNDWEEVLFQLITRSFGARVNREAFGALSGSIPFRVVRKFGNNPRSLEALFMGMSGLLHARTQADGYQRMLWKEYNFLKRKYGLHAAAAAQPDFFRLRPNNFPTIRLSQLAMLYGTRPRLFSKVINASSLEATYKILEVETSSYWRTHYLFGKRGRHTRHKVSRQFMQLIFLNTLLPLRYLYAKRRGENVLPQLLEMASGLPPESNRVVNGFRNSGLSPQDAIGSQAALQQFETLCKPGRCLDCMIGNQILFEL